MQSLITTAAGAVVVIVLSIFTLRIKLVAAENDGNLPKARAHLVRRCTPLPAASKPRVHGLQGSGGILASFINALQIQILNLVYMKLALILNDWGAVTSCVCVLPILPVTVHWVMLQRTT